MAAEDRKPSQKGESAVIKAYLVAYNVAQMLGWLIMLMIAVSHYTTNGRIQGMFTAVEPLMKIFQTAAVLEILHCAVGFVKSNVVLTAFQVYSRVFLVWGIIHTFPKVQDGAGIAALLFAWSVTEIIRYGYYFFSLVGQVPYFLVWCRYTFFIILYPIGVTGELMAIWAAMPLAQRQKTYSLEMPNRLNMAFNYYYYLWFVVLAYIPVFPQLYTHMLSQRKKIIGQRPKTD